MTEWRRASLRDLMCLDLETEPVDPEREYRIVGVLNRGRGLLHREALKGSDTKYGSFNRVRPDQVVYSRLKAFEGAITVATDLAGVAYASQEFPTFTCGHDLLPRFFRLVTTYPPFWDDLANKSKGMGGRRERVKPGDFLDLSLIVPPLDEQRRMVDLIGALDAQIAVLAAEQKASQELLALTRAELLDEGPEMRGGDAFDILMGRQRSPGRATGPSMTPYLRAANIKDGSLELSDVKEMDFTEVERAQFAVVEGDVLVSEGSGSAEAVGASARWAGEVSGPLCFQNTLLRFREKVGVSTAAFVYHWCRWAYESGAFRSVASGTNILHIGSTRAVEMRVRVPTVARQSEIAITLDALERLQSGLREERETLVSLRRTLLSGLLLGDVEIPESYDSLLAEAF